MTTHAAQPGPDPIQEPDALRRSFGFAARALAYIDAGYLSMAEDAIRAADREAALAFPDCSSPGAAAMALLLDAVDNLRVATDRGQAEVVELAEQFTRDAAA